LRNSRRVIERSPSAAWDLSERKSPAFWMNRHMSSETFHTVPFKA
jgi:hypothetical protein